MFDTVVVERLLLSYGSGVLAAVSPCVIVLVPLVMFRFVAAGTTGHSHHSHSTAAAADANANGNGNAHTNGTAAKSTSGDGDSANSGGGGGSSQMWLLSVFVLGFQ